MRIYQSIFLTASMLAAAVSVSSCYDGRSDVAFTKAEARRHGGRNPDGGDDLCRTHGWYTDDVCDMFCPERDPECEQCAAPQSDDVWYASTDPRECQLLDFVCPDGATHFSNDCGCGCTGVTPPPVCDDVICDMHCEYGFQQDDRGCDICLCSPPSTCTPVTCEIACEFGFATGPDGCEICACNPPPTCPAIDCPAIDCAYGYRTDDNGCHTCECNPPPACPPVACDIFCAHGHRRDANGCDTCECNPPPACPPVACDILCTHGHRRDANGCETCECNPPPTCDAVVCQLACEHGFQRDADGCEICACNEPPICEDQICPAIVCRYGFTRDENGCQTCECAEPPVCPDVLCDIACEHGRLADANGCETCICNPAPSCQPMDVRFVGGCEPAPRYFFNGFECVGQSGCECVGSDCDRTYTTAAECEAATNSCDCPHPYTPGIEYASQDPMVCALIDFACPEGAQGFGGECGCGCITAQ